MYTYLRRQSLAPVPRGTLLLIVAIMLLMAVLPAQRPLVLQATFSAASGATSPPPAAPDFGKLPLSFVPNAGQGDPAVRFQASAMGGTLFFTPSEVVLALPTDSDQRGALNNRQPDNLLDRMAQHASRPVDYTVVRLGFEGADPAAAVIGAEPLPGVVNYFIGNDPARWRTNVPTYAAIVYHALYPGIDLRYDGTGGRLKGTYTLTPGADPARIRWRYQGAASARVDAATGDLRISLADQELIEHAPVAWQDIGGRRVAISAHYAVAEDGTISFTLGDYDHAQPLTIDPTLEYSTYLGGSAKDLSTGIALDRAGNVYLVGTTWSPDFPTSAPLQPSNRGQADVFVIKLAPDGRTPLFSTYLGGTGVDNGNAIALDGDSNIYLVGGTDSDNFPTTTSAYSQTISSSNDVFVVKISADGAHLAYSTYLGGKNSDTALGVAVDASGSAYVTGYTDSMDFPNTPNAYQSEHAGVTDAFVVKLNPTFSSTNSLLYSTYFGGNDRDSAQDITVDASGNAYITGSTASADFPTRNSLNFTTTLTTTYNGATYTDVGDACVTGSAQIHFPCPDVFVAAFDFDPVLTDPDMTLRYSTYLGGNSYEFGSAITIDSAGYVYVTGPTISTNFPTINPYQTEKSGNYDWFVTKLNLASTAPIYSTHLGGNDWDWAEGIAVDSADNVYVTGQTLSTDFATPGAPQDQFADRECTEPAQGTFKCRDAALAKLSADGRTLRYATYLGGKGDESGMEVAVDAFGNAYLTGSTTSTDFPTVPRQPPRGDSNYDGFLAKIATDPVWFVAPGGDDSNDCQTPATPCEHIGAAIDKAAGGDTISIGAGTYTENLAIGKNLTLSGAGKAATIIDGNNAGAVVTISGTVSVTISGITLQHGQSPNGGGINNTRGTLTLQDSIVQNNTATELAGGVYNSLGTLTLNRSSVISNTLSSGSVYSGGGGIYSSGGTVTLTNSTVSGNKITLQAAHGGGIQVVTSTLTMTGATVDGNSTDQGEGGGIFAYTSTLTLNASTISNNTALDGGGIDLFVGSSLILSGSTISANTAGRFGGGIYNDVGIMTLNGSTVSANKANGAGGGGGIYNNGNSTLTNSTISGNIASQSGGGGIRNIASATLMCDNCTISGNRAGGVGGGISSVSISTSVLSNSTVISNTAAGAGGGIHNDATVQLNNTVVADNLVDSTTGPANGGGIANTGTLTITNGLISSNRLENPGGDGILGGVPESGGGIWSPPGSRLALSHSTISGHRVGGNPGQSYGGGLYLQGATAVLTDVVVSGNEALGNGGGIYAENTTLTITGSTISGNRAKFANLPNFASCFPPALPGEPPVCNYNEGGGIHVNDSGTIAITNSTISGNHSDNIAGGIFWQGTNINTTLNHVTITNNTARQGGGIWSNDQTTTVRARGSIVAANQSSSALNTSDTDCQGRPGWLISEGGNLFGIAGECNPTGNDLAGTEANPLDPRLGPLQNNGGPTPTHALLPRSPAIDKVPASICPPTDQRGAARPWDGDGDGTPACDIGAFEAHFDVASSGVRFPDDIPSMQNPEGAINERDYRTVFGDPTITSVNILTDTATITATDHIDLPFSLRAKDVVASLPISVEVSPDGSQVIMPNLNALMYETTVVTATYADANVNRAGSSLKAGLCVGMTSMTADFWAGADQAPYGGPPVNAIQPTDKVHSRLQQNHMRQVSAEVLSYLADDGHHDDVMHYLDDLASRIKQQARIGQQTWKQDSEIIGIVNHEGEPDQTCADAEVGHALWPYQVVRQADPPLYRIYVYDPNYPAVPSGSAENHYIEIFQSGDKWKWSYTIEPGAGGRPDVTWSGTTLYSLPLKVLLAKSTLPTEDDQGVLLVNGGQDSAFGGRSGAWGGRSGAWGQLANGQLIGCLPGQGGVFFTSTISRSLRLFSLNGPALYIPTQQLRDSGSLTFHSRGGEVSDMLIIGKHTVIGYLGTVGDPQNTEDQLTVDAALQSAALRTNEQQVGKQITIYQMHEGEPGANGVSETRVVAVSNTNVTAGQSLTMTVIKDAQGDVTGMTVINSSGEIKTADIGLASAGGKGFSTVVFPSQPIEPGAQYTFEPSNWHDLEHTPVRVEIDTDGDGHPDRIEILHPFPAPSSRVLDSFDRRDGPLGPTWAGRTDADEYRIVNHQVAVREGGALYWKAQQFGPTQEAFVTLSRIASDDGRASLLLKVQGDNPNLRKGAIEVRYDAKHHHIRIMTREPNRLWKVLAIIPTTFVNGDRLGARALADGRVQVYHNETLVSEANIGAYFANRGGRIGLRYLDARGARFDDFGGGTAP